LFHRSPPWANVSFHIDERWLHRVQYAVIPARWIHHVSNMLLFFHGGCPVATHCLHIDEGWIHLCCVR